MGKRKVLVVLLASCLGTFSTVSGHSFISNANANLGSPRASINFADINMGDPEEETSQNTETAEDKVIVGPPGAKISISDINLDSDEVGDKSLTTLQPLSLTEKETAPITELKPTLVPKAKSLDLKPLSLNPINNVEEPAPITELAPTIVPKKGDFSGLNIMAAQEPLNKETEIDEEDRMIGSPRANTIIGQVRIDDGSDEIKSVIFKKSDGTAQENNYLQPLEAPKEVSSILTKERVEKQENQVIKKEAPVTSKPVASTKAKTVKDEPTKTNNQSQIKPSKAETTEVKVPVEKEQRKPVFDVKRDKVVNKIESNKMADGSITLDKTTVETQSQDTMKPQSDVSPDAVKETAPTKPASNDILESVDIITNIEYNLLQPKAEAPQTVEQPVVQKEERAVVTKETEIVTLKESEVPAPVEIVETKKADGNQLQDSSTLTAQRVQTEGTPPKVQTSVAPIDVVEDAQSDAIETTEVNAPQVSEETVVTETASNIKQIDSEPIDVNKSQEMLTEEQLKVITAPVLATEELSRLKMVKVVDEAPVQNEVTEKVIEKEVTNLSEPAKAPELPKEIDAVSYAIGVSYGQGIAKEFINGYQLDLNRESMLKGVEDALKGEQLYSQEEMDAIYNELNAKIQNNIERNKLMQAELSKQKGDRFRAFYAKQKGVKQTSSGLLYRVILTGDSHTPTQESLVTVRYAGKLLDGTIFEQMREPIQVPLSGLVPSWKEGLPMIGRGGRIELVVPPEMGFGDKETRGIPGNSTLIFEIELLDVQP